MFGCHGDIWMQIKVPSKMTHTNCIFSFFSLDENGLFHWHLLYFTY